MLNRRWRRIISTVGLLLLLPLKPCDGHGHMTYPESTRHGGSLLKGGDCDESRGACYWFTNNQPIPGKPTLNDAWIRSVNVDESGSSSDWSKMNPWRAPGSTPVFGSGCGVAGGGPIAYANGGKPPKGIEQGTDGLTLPKKTATVWPRGSVQQVGAAVSANHAGGYSWRLCKDDGNVSEACFQQNTLRFAGSKQWIVYANGEWSEIPLVMISQGTFPEGSEWARFPVPSCKQCDPSSKCGTPLAPTPGRDYNSPWNRQVNCNAMCHGAGASKGTGSCPGATQFPEPIPGMSGYGKSIWEWSVVDEVLVPEGLEPGDYLLSWRWDCEQSDQVFQNCADIKITVDNSSSPAKINMDPSKQTTVYKGSGNVKCDGLYETCSKGKKKDKRKDKYEDKVAEVGNRCVKYGIEGCSKHDECTVVQKKYDGGVKKYCWVDEKKMKATRTIGDTCVKYGVDGCSKHAECHLIEAKGKTYCWVTEEHMAGLTCEGYGVDGCSKHVNCTVMREDTKEVCWVNQAGLTCAAYGVDDCSNHVECTVITSEEHTYCWVKEKGEPGSDPAASNANQLGSDPAASNAEKRAHVWSLTFLATLMLTANLAIRL